MEKLMQYVWQHRLWESQGLTTVDGKRIRVIDPGVLNTDAGPDFFNAKIEIDREMWVGNVEIHVRASDWFRHHHDSDPAYDSVILHVVDKDDAPVMRSNGEVIPQCEMHCSVHFNERYRQFIESSSQLMCGTEIASTPHITITEWVEALAFERLQGKADKAKELLKAFSGSWEDVCYVTLARNLGFGINNDAFERLARRTPLRLVAKHSDSLTQIEALLFGNAGLLDPNLHRGDSYYQSLCREYAFLANKFDLRPLEGTIWKMFRVRPQGFPHRRIAMLAQMLHGGFGLFTNIIEADGEPALRSLFDINLTGYWATHYSFDSPTATAQKALSRSSVDIILINTVAPLFYAYGESIDNYDTTLRAIQLLESLKPERNNIVQLFEKCGLKADSALVSQALIQLRRNYCEARKYIYCRIGHKLLSIAAMTK